MNDFQTKLIEVIAAKVITEGHMSDLQLPGVAGVLRWTGWKSSAHCIEPHAQIIWFMPEQKFNFYCDIPSMQHGKFERGAAFGINFVQDKSHYLNEDTTINEIREWFKEAFALLLGDVLAENPWLTEHPLEKK